MKSVRIIEYEGLGEVKLRKYKACRSLRILVGHDGSVRVSLPYWVTWQSAIDFLSEKLDWVVVQKRKLTRQLRDIPRIRPLSKDEISAAKDMLTARLRFLASRHGYKFNRVTVRNQKTLWGSCSSDNDISLNINLIHLPPELIDYILLHELAHTKAKDHSPNFWKELDKRLGQPGKGKAMQKELRNYRIMG